MSYECDHELSLNGLWLHGRGVDEFDPAFSFDVSAGSFEFGSSEAVTSVIESLWADGSLMSHDRDDNAESTFQVLIEGEDLTALAAGEAALEMAFPPIDGAVDLIWRPGDSAPAAVRTVLAAKMVLDSEGIEEESQRLQRVWSLTLTHAPFVASEFPSVVSALPVGPVGDDLIVENVGSLASSSGWSGVTDERASTSSSAVDPGGFVRTTITLLPIAPYLRNYTWRASRTIASTSFMDTPYLVVEHRTPIAVNLGEPLRAALNTHLLPPQVKPISMSIVSSVPTFDGWTRTTFYVGPRADVTSFTLWGLAKYPTTRSNLTVDVRLMERTSAPVGDRGLSLLRAIEVGGTKRTPGTLQVSSRDGVTPLGEVLIHTCPDFGDSYQPDSLAGGTVTYTSRTAGSDAPSGYWYSMASGGYVEPVVEGYRYAEGSYLLVAALRSSAAATIKLTAAVTSTATISMVTPLNVVETVTSGEEVFEAAGIRYVPIGAVTLPGVASRFGAVATRITGTTSAGTAAIGGIWALRLGRDCGTTIVRDDMPHLWVNSSARTRLKSVRVSTDPTQDWSWDPGYAAVRSLAEHTFRPGRMLTYTVTQTPHAAVSLLSTRRWNSHPANDGTDS